MTGHKRWRAACPESGLYGNCHIPLDTSWSVGNPCQQERLQEFTELHHRTKS